MSQATYNKPKTSKDNYKDLITSGEIERGAETRRINVAAKKYLARLTASGAKKVIEAPLNNAATKIQKVFRGEKVRRNIDPIIANSLTEIEKIKAQRQDATNIKRQLLNSGEIERAGEQMRLKIAAKKIQKTFRGHEGRKEFDKQADVKEIVDDILDNAMNRAVDRSKAAAVVFRATRRSVAKNQFNNKKLNKDSILKEHQILLRKNLKSFQSKISNADNNPRLSQETKDSIAQNMNKKISKIDHIIQFKSKVGRPRTRSGQPTQAEISVASTRVHDPTVSSAAKFTPKKSK